MGTYDVNAFEGLSLFFFGITSGFREKLSNFIGIQHVIFKVSVMPHVCGGVTNRSLYLSGT